MAWKPACVSTKNNSAAKYEPVGVEPHSDHNRVCAYFWSLGARSFGLHIMKARNEMAHIFAVTTRDIPASLKIGVSQAYDALLSIPIFPLTQWFKVYDPEIYGEHK